MVPYFNFEIIELQSMSVHMQYPSLFHAYHILCLTAFFNTSRQLPPHCVLSDIEFAIYDSKECWCNWFLTFLYIWAKLVFVLHMHSIFFLPQGNLFWEQAHLPNGFGTFIIRYIKTKELVKKYIMVKHESLSIFVSFVFIYDLRSDTK